MTENDCKNFPVVCAVSQLLCSCCEACLQTNPSPPLYKAGHGSDRV